METFDIIGCVKEKFRFSLLAKNIKRSEVSEVVKRYKKYKFIYKFPHPQGIAACQKLNSNPCRI